jgi:outer membrane immunogenic protein
MKKLLCASTASLALVLASAVLTPADAADLSIAPIYRAPPTPVATWTGSYVGISGGGAWGSAVVRNEITGADQTPRIDLDAGGIVGVTGGFNIQNGNGVLGFEGDISATSKKGSAFEFPPNAAFNNEVKERWLSTFRGRIGYAQDNWLFYATAGGALANVEASIFAPAGTISDQQWHWGWTAGGGVEVKLSQDWSAKVEYLYVGLQDKSYFNPAPSPVFPSNQRLHIDDHIVRVGVNYKLPWNVLDSFFKH